MVKTEMDRFNKTRNNFDVEKEIRERDTAKNLLNSASREIR